MKTRTVYLSLGSNLGDRAGNLRAAVDLLKRELAVRSISSLYETDPVGVADQPAFLNIAVEAETHLEPEELLGLVKRIEQQVGRRPTYRWGPRVVDLDILLIDGETVESEALVVPHREMAGRAFVLAPLAEIAPDVVHPVLGTRVRDLLAQLSDRGVRRIGPL
jgi:2-amino-4-hydroxy-6-hydroxymethyldihydropteridine diphosphokinase